jgi:hypothetical protein
MITIAVFLNNKLITADTSVPLMLALKTRYKKVTIKYLCADNDTFKILQNNVVLWDAIIKTGSILNLGSPSRSILGRLIGVLKKLAVLSHLMITSKISTTFIIHFRALNYFPFSMLAYVNSQRTILMEPGCWGYSRVMQLLGDQSVGREPDARPGKCSALIAFAEDWPELHHSEHAAKNKYLLNSTHLYDAWLKHVRESQYKYLWPTLKELNRKEDSKYFVIILGTLGELGYLKKRQSTIELFREILDILQCEFKSIPVLIKPHAITDPSLLDQELVGRNRSQFVVTHLHPAVLATQAISFLGTYFSLSFCDAIALGVPTIEYTDYSEEYCHITEGGSMRPEKVSYFVPHDPLKLLMVLRHLSAAQCQREFPEPLAAGKIVEMLGEGVQI